MIYPPEVLNFSIRANGLAVNNFFANAVGFVLPISSLSPTLSLVVIRRVRAQADRLMVTD